MSTQNPLSGLDLPLLLTPEQVRRLRPCHGATLHRARKAGKLEYTKLNARVYLYHRASVLKWLGLEAQEREMTARAPAQRSHQEEGGNSLEETPS